MAHVMQYEFILFGPRKGQTVNINGHRFVNGRAVLVQSSESMGACMRVLSFYGAYARGTLEYNEAVAAEEAKNGAGKVDPATLEGADAPVRGDVRPDGPGPAKEAADVGAGDVDPSGASGSGGDSGGNGHEHAGVPKFPEDKDHRPVEPSSKVNEAVKTAIMKLDPGVDSHWVATGAHKGKPKLQAVEEAYGRSNLGRADLEAALPGWNRDAALEAALPA